MRVYVCACTWESDTNCYLWCRLTASLIWWQKAGRTTNSALLQRSDGSVQEQEYLIPPSQRSSAEHRLWNMVYYLDLKENLKVQCGYCESQILNRLLLLVLTVVGNCHGYEGTNGLKNLSTWQSNLLKPHFYNGKNWHTNALSLFWKKKEKEREKKATLQCFSGNNAQDNAETQ